MVKKILMLVGLLFALSMPVKATASEISVTDMEAGLYSQEKEQTVFNKEDGVETGTMGANNQITWCYDTGTKTLTMTGKDSDTRYECGSCIEFLYNNYDIEHIIFKDCQIKGGTSYLFQGFSKLKSVDLSGLDTSAERNMEYMFDGCSGLTSLDLSDFDTRNVRYMNNMFYGCSSLGQSLKNFS